MARNVVYLPGLLGSNLGYNTGPNGSYHPVWLDLFSILTGQMATLQLAADGIHPGPLAEGIVVQPNGIFAPAYEPLAAVMVGFGWNVLRWGFDWRKSVLTQAGPAWSAIRQFYGTQPFWIVAHSQGGLLARAIYGQMVQSGADSQLAGIVTICTPQFGSFEIVRLFNRMPLTYRALVLATGWQDWQNGTPGPAYLDAILATCGGFYELLPFRAAGPLWSADPTQAAALYQLNTYQSGNPFLDPNQFAAAEVSQTILIPLLPAGRLTTILGRGYRTAYSLSGAALPNADEGYLYTQEGDGQVTVAEGQLPGVPFLILDTSHGLACLDPRVWALVAQIIA